MWTEREVVMELARMFMVGELVELPESVQDLGRAAHMSLPDKIADEITRQMGR